MKPLVVNKNKNKLKNKFTIQNTIALTNNVNIMIAVK